MVDIGKFPGTEMEVFSKYPDSYRLDHPNFKDVAKTTFAKGVISDFKVDDPNDLIGTISSQVKVTGGFGESDWIPIFYHPKPQYWDDDNHKATDFNKEGGYFERAWMSFRCGDEVAVMLKEEKPVAVMGFADGIPRIGENIFKAEFETVAAGKHYFLWRLFGDGAPENYPVHGMNGIDGVLNPWDGKASGPDNVALALTQKCQLLSRITVAQDYSGSFQSGDPGFPWHEGFYTYTRTGNTSTHLNRWIVPIGPFMFLFSVVSQDGSSAQSTNAPGGGDGGGYSGWIVTNDDPPQTIFWVNGSMSSTSLIDIKVAVALFNQEVIDKIQPPSGDISSSDYVTNQTDWWLPQGFKVCDSVEIPFKYEYYADYTPNPGWNIDFKFFLYQTGSNDYYNPGRPENVPEEIWNLRNYVPKWETAKFLARPHTKSELQAAGMWPAGAL